MDYPHIVRVLLPKRLTRQILCRLQSSQQALRQETDNSSNYSSSNNNNYSNNNNNSNNSNNNNNNNSNTSNRLQRNDSQYGLVQKWTYYNQELINREASKVLRLLTPTQLMFAGRSVDGQHRLKSSQFLQQELPRRIARRVKDFQVRI